MGVFKDIAISQAAQTAIPYGIPVSTASESNPVTTELAPAGALDVITKKLGTLHPTRQKDVPPVVHISRTPQGITPTLEKVLAARQAKALEREELPDEWDDPDDPRMFQASTNHFQEEGVKAESENVGVIPGTTPRHPHLITAGKPKVREAAFGCHNLLDTSQGIRTKKMANLLIETTPHQILPELANEIGLYEAIFLQQLHWLINESKDVTFHNNELWWRHTQQQWVDRIPYLKNKRRVENITRELLSLGLIHVETFDYEIFGKKGSNANWYRVNYDNLAALSKPIVEEIRERKLKEAEKRRKDENYQNSSTAPVLSKNPQNGSSPQNGSFKNSQNGGTSYKNYKYKKKGYILESQNDTADSHFSENVDSEMIDSEQPTQQEINQPALKKKQKTANQGSDSDKRIQSETVSKILKFIALWKQSAIDNQFPIKIKSGDNGYPVEYFGQPILEDLEIYLNHCEPEQLIQAMKYYSHEITSSDEWRDPDHGKFQAGIAWFLEDSDRLIHCLKSVCH